MQNKQFWREMLATTAERMEELAVKMDNAKTPSQLAWLFALREINVKFNERAKAELTKFHQEVEAKTVLAQSMFMANADV